ncbi:MAG: hypothetical protein WC817_01380 [Patescibacteria group bacterium]
MVVLFEEWLVLRSFSEVGSDEFTTIGSRSAVIPQPSPQGVVSAEGGSASGGLSLPSHLG